MSSRQQEARIALDRYLSNVQFLKALCFSYEAEKSGMGRLYLAPSGLGDWMWVATDTHPLALPIPSISEDEYLLLKGRINPGQDDITDLLARVQTKILQAWKMIAFQTDEPEHSFNDPVAL